METQNEICHLREAGDYGLIEQSYLPVRRTLEKLGIQPARFDRWYDRLQTGGPEALRHKREAPSASGTASLMQYASGCQLALAEGPQ